MAAAKQLTKRPNQFSHAARSTMAEQNGWFWDLTHWVLGYGGACADLSAYHRHLFTDSMTALYAAWQLSWSQAMSPPRHMKRQPRPIHFLAESKS